MMKTPLFFIFSSVLSWQIWAQADPPHALPAHLPPGACNTPCNVADSLALVMIYQVMNGAQWDTDKRWDLSACVASWYGVGLNVSGRVTILDLDGEIAADPISGSDACVLGVTDLTTVFPDQVNLPELRALSLAGNILTGSFPDLTNLKNLTRLNLNCTQLNTLLPGNKLPKSLQEFYIENAGLSGVLPDLDLPKLNNLNLKKNFDLKGPLPAWKKLESIQSIALSRCNFKGVVPGYSHVLPGNLRLFLPSNRLTFEDVLPNWEQLKKRWNVDLDSQALFSLPETRQVAIGCPFRWDVGIDDTVTSNTYHWYHNGAMLLRTDSNTLFIKEMPDTLGGVWVCKVTNSRVPKMHLESYPLTVLLCQPEVMTVDTALCRGQSLVVRGILYDEQHPEGKQQIIGKATNGCDSVIWVHLRYPESKAGPDTILCRDSLVLRAQLPEGFTGLWSADPAAVIADPTSAVTKARVLQEGETRFLWTVSAPRCPTPTTNTATVFFDRAPTARLDSLTIFIDRDTSGNFLFNDLLFDPNVDVISVQPPPKGGVFNWDDDGHWDFIPNKRYWGTFKVQYTLCSGFCPPEHCDTAEVWIKVVPAGQPVFVSANGDGINDVFVLQVLAADPDAFPESELLILSEDGSILLSSKGYRNDWPVGELPPQGVYYYFFRASPDDPPIANIICLTR